MQRPQSLEYKGYSYIFGINADYSVYTFRQSEYPFNDYWVYTYPRGVLSSPIGSSTLNT